MGFKPVRNSHGHLTGEFRFVPSAKMYRVAAEFNKDENQGLSNEELLKKCSVSQAEWKRWWTENTVVSENPDGTINTRNHFEEFWDSNMQMKSGEERALLKQIGMHKAMEGDFRFWKEMSSTHGAIQDAPLESPKKKIPAKLPDNATREQILDLRQKLLESQRALGDSGGIGLVRTTTRRSKGPNG